MRINYVAVYPARQDGEPAYAHLMRVAQANGVKRVATLAANLGLNHIACICGLRWRPSGASVARMRSASPTTRPLMIAILSPFEERRSNVVRSGLRLASDALCPACYARTSRQPNPISAGCRERGTALGGTWPRSPPVQSTTAASFHVARNALSRSIRVVARLIVAPTTTRLAALSAFPLMPKRCGPPRTS